MRSVVVVIFTGGMVVVAAVGIEATRVSGAGNGKQKEKDQAQNN